MDYLPYRRTNHALAFYTILTSAELAQYEIFAKVSGVPFSSPARSEIFSTVNGVPLHMVFQYHPPIVLIDLNTVKKKDVKRKSSTHSSFLLK